MESVYCLRGEYELERGEHGTLKDLEGNTCGCIGKGIVEIVYCLRGDREGCDCFFKGFFPVLVGGTRRPYDDYEKETGKEEGIQVFLVEIYH